MSTDVSEELSPLSLGLKTKISGAKAELCSSPVYCSFLLGLLFDPED
jgi:hypothetical protein